MLLLSLLLAYPFSLLCLFFGGCFTDHHKCLKNPPAIPKEYPYTSEILKEYCDAEVAEFTKRFGSGWGNFERNGCRLRKEVVKSAKDVNDESTQRIHRKIFEFCFACLGCVGWRSCGMKGEFNLRDVFKEYICTVGGGSSEFSSCSSGPDGFLECNASGFMIRRSVFVQRVSEVSLTSWNKSQSVPLMSPRHPQNSKSGFMLYLSSTWNGWRNQSICEFSPVFLPPKDTSPNLDELSILPFAMLLCEIRKASPSSSQKINKMIYLVVLFFFIFTPTWGNDPIWLIFFKLVETTN